MASLDEMEGAAIEAVGVVLLVVLAVMAWGIYKGVSTITMPDLAKFWNNILRALDAHMPSMDWLRFYVEPYPGAEWGGGGDMVRTGISGGSFGSPPKDELPTPIEPDFAQELR